MYVGVHMNESKLETTNPNHTLPVLCALVGISEDGDKGERLRLPAPPPAQQLGLLVAAQSHFSYR